MEGSASVWSVGEEAAGDKRWTLSERAERQRGLHSNSSNRDLMGCNVTTVDSSLLGFRPTVCTITYWILKGKYTNRN